MTEHHPPEDGYRLWLRYDAVNDPELRSAYRRMTRQLVFPAGSDVLRAALEELVRGLAGLLGEPVPLAEKVTLDGALVVGTAGSLGAKEPIEVTEQLRPAGEEGFVIAGTTLREKQCTLVTANSDIGVMYGVFHLLRHMQKHSDLGLVPTLGAPRIRLRILDHWDNPDGTVERGYAGKSLWDWGALPDVISPRYADYARANASIGINGAVLNNVNADPRILTEEYLVKAAALARVFRPYGIRVYLTARFDSPVRIGGLSSADPLSPRVISWWARKAREIYDLIPDFGGFLVKAGSEGQPGPQDYGRTHADGANLLADSLSPFGGKVMWRAFVYKADASGDRARQSYDEFMPLDGMFHQNVLLQVKNGPIDFQPREPFHPLFGGMERTPLMLELQITQEYLGFAAHLAYLAPLFKETLDSDTFCRGPGSPVARVVDGTIHGHAPSGIAGVANIGGGRNWCGHHFAQANWYAFGRIAWDHSLGSEEIADEWIRMTFTNETRAADEIRAMMMGSREAVVDYMTPLGLHHIMGRDHHHGPAPWVAGGRPDWTSVYYHRADRAGIGFDRGPAGSNAAGQYRPPLRDAFSSVESCPEELLLWFHHVGWDHVMKDGRTLWDGLCLRYQRGVDAVRGMRRAWESVKGRVDEGRFEHVRTLLGVQETEAIWWRDACIAYFQSISGRPLPPGVEKPALTLEQYIDIQRPG